MKKPKKTPKPKARNVWQINPKSRVEKSSKTFLRSKEKTKLRRLLDKLDWFGEKKKK